MTISRRSFLCSLGGVAVLSCTTTNVTNYYANQPSDGTDGGPSGDVAADVQVPDDVVTGPMDVDGGADTDAAATANCSAPGASVDAAFDAQLLPQLAAVGGMVAFDASSSLLLLIRAAQDQVVALGRICGHAACEMTPGSIGKWDTEKQQLTCLCHSSVYDIDGKLLSGPGGSDLLTYPVPFDSATGKGSVRVPCAA
ncbi:MAG: Rieske (2Fe-2S) protein [Deltaproteobacteria bacterium]|nr:Rieske (2Fe-2S) protein [Deltaproteobacteria bacterium]